MNTQVAERPAEETFIVAKSDDGYRVCSPMNPARQFTVTGIPDDPQCNCPDFTHPDRPPDWQCKHILAVLKYASDPAVNSTNGTPSPATAGSRGPDGPPPRTERKAPNGRNGRGGAVMLLKRSISPDGHIDSFSVEFSCPVAAVTTSGIKEQAAVILALQSEIAAGFLKTNGNGKSTDPTRNGSSSPDFQNAVPGQLLAVASMNGRWGKRLFLNIQVNGQVLKCFGTEKQLAEAVANAGYQDIARLLTDGMALNLPCRVTTKPSPDGKYVNVERVLPAQPKG